MSGLVCLVALLATCPVQAGDVEPGKYETGYGSAAKLTQDLYRALENKQRGQLYPVPVLLETVTIPYMQPSQYFDGTNNWQAVQISAGFVNLINYLSHAKAIEGVEVGYYEKSLASLASAATDKPMPVLQNISSQKSWDFDVINHQVSQFNQMVGALIAVDMAHHYLGHYKKYASRLVDAQNHAVAINTVITPKEWHEAVMKGARNALDCGLGVEGLQTVFESLEKMQARPAWSVYFLPQQANTAKIKKDLARMEKDFFLSSK